MARRQKPQRIVSSDDESSSDSGHSSPSNQPHNGESHGLFDLEASDDDDSTTSSSEEGSDVSSDLTFPKFLQLPPELRDRIWELFCPDLTEKSRLLHLNLKIDQSASYSVGACGYMYEGTFLAGQTEPFRRFSSVHQATRQRALQVAPDELKLDYSSEGSVLRFKAANDILLFNNYEHHSVAATKSRAHLGGIAEHIALPRGFKADLALDSIFPNLRTVYTLTDEHELNARWLRWCGTDYAQKYYYEHLEDVEPVPMAVPVLHCWPDVQRHPDFSKFYLAGLAHMGIPVDDVELAEELGITLLPMVCFVLHRAMERFEEAERSKHVPLPDLPNDWPSEREDAFEDDDEDEPSDYESEGIDDDEILEADDPSEDELIPDPISPGSGIGSPGSIISPRERATAAANFSSVEPSEDERLVLRGPAVGGARKRRIVSDSDDSEDEGGESGTRAATQSKRRRITRTLESDSEAETGVAARSAQTGDANASDEETTSSSSEESKVPAPKPLYFTKRLRGQQPTRQTTDSSDSGSGEDESDDDVVGSSDDDEDEDEDEDEDTTSRRLGAFFLNEASESESNEGEDEDEYESDG